MNVSENRTAGTFKPFKIYMLEQVLQYLQLVLMSWSDGKSLKRS